MINSFIFYFIASFVFKKLYNKVGFIIKGGYIFFCFMAIFIFATEQNGLTRNQILLGILLPAIFGFLIGKYGLKNCFRKLLGLGAKGVISAKENLRK